MDKKATLKSLDRITNRVLEDCRKEELTQILLAEILKDIVNEMPDNRSFIELVKDVCDVEANDYLSFAQALEAAAKGKRVTHETWSKRTYITQVGDRFVRASIDNDNVDDRIGITTEMLTGWIVLDR